MKRAVIVMPAYQAESTIESVFKRIPKNILEKIYSIIVVDDGCTDKTEEIIKKLQEENNKIILLKHGVNKGYGAAQKTGFNKALGLEADIAILLHSDGQYPPEIIEKMISPLENGYDVVLGSRILGGEALKGGMPLIKYIGNRGLTFIENLAYGLNISEYHSGYMAYSSNALRTIKFNALSNNFHFDGEMTMMAGKKKLRIKEVPIPTTYANEKSHLNIFAYGFDVLSIIFKYLRGGYNL
ncbi:glycosyltransferase [Candidatus Woesearchaeota archaeon]|nr:glycosyltransferase [Candidatus Woesearchaeota archaeon]